MLKTHGKLLFDYTTATAAPFFANPTVNAKARGVSWSLTLFCSIFQQLQQWLRCSTESLQQLASSGFPVDCSKTSERCLEDCPSPRSGRHRAAKPDGKGDRKSSEIIHSLARSFSLTQSLSLSVSLHLYPHYACCACGPSVHLQAAGFAAATLKRSEQSDTLICILRSAAPFPSSRGDTLDNRQETAAKRWQPLLVTAAHLPACCHPSATALFQ